MIHECTKKDKKLERDVYLLKKNAEKCKDLKDSHKKKECAEKFEKDADCLNKYLSKEEDDFDKCILEKKRDDKNSEKVK